jgi:hypothetical protein
MMPELMAPHRHGKFLLSMTLPGTGLRAFDRPAFMQKSVYNPMIYRLLQILLDKALV